MLILFWGEGEISSLSPYGLSLALSNFPYLKHDFISIKPISVEENLALLLFPSSPIPHIKVPMESYLTLIKEHYSPWTVDQVRAEERHHFVKSCIWLAIVSGGTACQWWIELDGIVGKKDEMKPRGEGSLFFLQLRRQDAIQNWIIARRQQLNPALFILSWHSFEKKAHFMKKFKEFISCEPFGAVLEWSGTQVE